MSLAELRLVDVQLPSTILTSTYFGSGPLQAKFFIPDLLFRDVTLRGFWIATWMHSMSTEERGKVVADIMQLLEKKVIAPHSG